MDVNTKPDVSEQGPAGPTFESKPKTAPISRSTEKLSGDGISLDNEVSGVVSLPLTRIKRVLKVNPEYVHTTEASIFSVAVATELFVKYLTEQGKKMADSENRKALHYKDFSKAIAKTEKLKFLERTAPQTITLRQLINKGKVPPPKQLTEEQLSTLDIKQPRDSSPENFGLADSPISNNNSQTSTVNNSNDTVSISCSPVAKKEQDDDSKMMVATSTSPVRISLDKFID